LDVRTAEGKTYLVGELAEPINVKYKMGLAPEVTVPVTTFKIREGSGLYRHGDIRHAKTYIIMHRNKIAIIPLKTETGIEFWLE